MKLLENGYFWAVRSQPVIDEPTPSQAIRGAAAVSQAIRGAAAVVGVIALVLALLVLGVYAVVTLDLMPLMR
jgi:hypothetical protein